MTLFEWIPTLNRKIGVQKKGKEKKKEIITTVIMKRKSK